MNPGAHTPDYLHYVVPVIVLLVLYLRMRRMMKPQALKLSRLWIRPVILMAVAAAILLVPVPGQAPLTPRDMLWLGLGAVLGAAAGWQWGRTTQLHLHPQNGTLMQTGSMAGVLVFAVLLLLRVGLRTGLGLEAGAWHINVLLITDVSIVFSVLLFSVRGLEIFLRARKVMAQATPAAVD